MLFRSYGQCFEIVGSLLKDSCASTIVIILRKTIDGITNAVVFVEIFNGQLVLLITTLKCDVSKFTLIVTLVMVVVPS